MTRIHLETIIEAPVKVCFDLSRSIEVHILSTEGSREEAIAGRTSGLLCLGETVTWRATHFLIRQTMSVIMAGMDAPGFFRDVMYKGPFSYMSHDHLFSVVGGKHTRMVDIFEYKVPFGFVGRFVDKFILKRYMQHLLSKRNRTIKVLAEAVTGY